MEKITRTIFHAGLGGGITGLGLAIALLLLGKKERRTRYRAKASVVKAAVLPDTRYIPSKINGHLAQPGPLYWDYRCMVCSEPVADHSFWGYIGARLKGWK